MPRHHPLDGWTRRAPPVSSGCRPSSPRTPTSARRPPLPATPRASGLPRPHLVFSTEPPLCFSPAVPRPQPVFAIERRRRTSLLSLARRAAHLGFSFGRHLSSPWTPTPAQRPAPPLPAAGPPLLPRPSNLLPTHLPACPESRKVRERKRETGGRERERVMTLHPDIWGLFRSHTDSAAICRIKPGSKPPKDLYEWAEI